MKFFYKNEVCKRVLSMVLAFVMIFTMFAAQLPSGLLEVQAAENDMNITVHFDNSVYNWGEPAIQFWGGSLTPSNYAGGPTEISGWGGAQGYSLVNEGNGWYSITLTGTCDGFQFVDLKNSGNNTGGKGYSANLTQYTLSPATDLYFKPYEDNYAGKWYTDIECTTEVTASLHRPSFRRGDPLVGDYRGGGCLARDYPRDRYRRIRILRKEEKSGKSSERRGK